MLILLHGTILKCLVSILGYNNYITDFSSSGIQVIASISIEWKNLEGNLLFACECAVYSSI